MQERASGHGLAREWQRVRVKYTARTTQGTRTNERTREGLREGRNITANRSFVQATSVLS